MKEAVLVRIRRLSLFLYEKLQRWQRQQNDDDDNRPTANILCFYDSAKSLDLVDLLFSLTRLGYSVNSAASTIVDNQLFSIGPGILGVVLYLSCALDMAWLDEQALLH